jgi:hypothetical protein
MSAGGPDSRAKKPHDSDQHLPNALLDIYFSLVGGCAYDFRSADGVRNLLGPPADFILCKDRSKMRCVCQFRPNALWPTKQETRLELLWVHEADRDSGMVEDAHHLARHVVRDDWALCAAAA